MLYITVSVKKIDNTVDIQNLIRDIQPPTVKELQQFTKKIADDIMKQNLNVTKVTLVAWSIFSK